MRKLLGKVRTSRWDRKIKYENVGMKMIGEVRKTV